MYAAAEAPMLRPPDVNSRFIGKDPDAGKDCGQEEKRMTEDEMVGWHHRIIGHVLGQTLGDGEGQGGLVCCSPWGHKESDMTQQLNNDSSFPSEDTPDPSEWRWGQMTQSQL